MQVVNYDSAWLETLTWNITIGDMAAYRAWYNSVNWDCYDNPGNCSSVPSYKVTFTAGAGGTVSGTSPQTITQGGSTASVTATPNCNYTFVNWKDQDGNIISTNAILSAQVISKAMTYTANFQYQSQSTEYSVKFLTSTGGTISGSTSQAVSPSGSATAVTAVPNNGYKFVNWTGSGGFIPTTNNPLTVSNVTADMAILANFQQYTVSASSSPDVGGTVTPAKQSVISGQSATLIAVKNPGYIFSNWTGCTSSTANPLTLSNVQSDLTCIANFTKLTQYTISSADAEKGSVSNLLNPAYEGESVSAIPKSGYRFVNWTDINNTPYATTNPLKLSAVSPTPISITANFASDSLNCNGDTKLDLADVIYILQVLAGLRP